MKNKMTEMLELSNNAFKKDIIKMLHLAITNALETNEKKLIKVT
jgi:hypothetical protein